jgi:chromosome partitioning protein
MIISFVSQKGGVGKTTLAELIATEFVKAGWDTQLADMDVQQQTANYWAADRDAEGVEPSVPSVIYRTPDTALRAAEAYELMVIDGAPHASKATKTISLASDLVIIPSGFSKADLRPALDLATELVYEGLDKNKIAIALNGVTESGREMVETRSSIIKHGFICLSGSIPFKQSYLKAQNEGRALNETSHTGLNEKADKLAQSVIDLLTKDK